MSEPAVTYKRDGVWFRRFTAPEHGERWEAYRVVERRLLYLNHEGEWVDAWTTPMEPTLFATESEAEEALAKALLGGGEL